MKLTTRGWIVLAVLAIAFGILTGQWGFVPA